MLYPLDGDLCSDSAIELRHIKKNTGFSEVPASLNPISALVSLGQLQQKYNCLISKCLQKGTELFLCREMYFTGARLALLCLISAIEKKDFVS